jgi:hypothetical protein
MLMAFLRPRPKSDEKLYPGIRNQKLKAKKTIGVEQITKADRYAWHAIRNQQQS